jgi:hypothetical protein
MERTATRRSSPRRSWRVRRATTSAAPSGMKTAPKCAPGKRKEQQQQITESERNVIASNIRPRQGASLARNRERPHTLRFCLPSPLLRLTPPSPENRICQAKLDSPAVAVITAPGPSSTWGWVAQNFICSSVKESCKRNSRCSSAVIFMVWKGFLYTGQAKSKDIKRCHKKMSQEQFRLDRRQGGNDLKKPGEQGCRRVDAKGS